MEKKLLTIDEKLENVYLKDERMRRNKNIIFKAFFLWAVELMMVYYVRDYFEYYRQDEQYFFSSIGTKFCCIFAIHVMQQPMILSSIKRLEYVLKHPEKFENMIFPLIFCIMKISIEVLIELCCIYATAFENFNVYTIMDFSALVVLNYFDMYYLQVF